jgi:hypothetical protein
MSKKTNNGALPEMPPANQPMPKYHFQGSFSSEQTMVWSPCKPRQSLDEKSGKSLAIALSNLR